MQPEPCAGRAAGAGTCTLLTGHCCTADAALEARDLELAAAWSRNQVLQEQLEQAEAVRATLAKDLRRAERNLSQVRFLQNSLQDSLAEHSN